MTEAETRAADHLDAFLRTFSDVQPAAVSALRAWADTGVGCREQRIGRRHLRSRTALDFPSRDAVLPSATGSWRRSPSSNCKANSPARTDDDARALRVAKAALSLVNRQLAEVDSEYWIGVLEEYGLLPNYTLLDDSVTLDVSMSWFDPDSGQYESSASSYQRGAANALREFAPGATFYARGFEIDVDAVDLGSGAEAVRDWAFCPDCGYAEDLEASGQITETAACPRCGSQGSGRSAAAHPRRGTRAGVRGRSAATTPISTTGATTGGEPGSPSCPRPTSIRPSCVPRGT